MPEIDFDAAVSEALAVSATPAAERRLGPKRLRYTHEDCIDFMIANPEVSQGALALRYGYSQGWMSLVINSDAFRARLAARRRELVDPTLEITLNERFNALTVKSLEVLQEKLSKPESEVPAQLALQAAALGARALGLGQAPAPAAPSADELSTLAERLVAFTRRSKEQGVVDVQVREVPQEVQRQQAA